MWRTLTTALGITPSVLLSFMPTTEHPLRKNIQATTNKNARSHQITLLLQTTNTIRMRVYQGKLIKSSKTKLSNLSLTIDLFLPRCGQSQTVCQACLNAARTNCLEFKDQRLVSGIILLDKYGAQPAFRPQLNALPAGH